MKETVTYKENNLYIGDRTISTNEIVGYGEAFPYKSIYDCTYYIYVDNTKKAMNIIKYLMEKKVIKRKMSLAAFIKLVEDVRTLI